MIALVSIDEARAQVRRDDTVDDVMLDSLVYAASAIVLSYIKIKVPDDDSPDTRISQMFGTDEVPDDVRIAVLLAVTDLYENREGQNADPLSQAVRDILHARRDPTLA